MNENKYSVVETPATKITVTISRRQMWNNFIDCWKDIAWDNYTGVNTLREVADILLNALPLRSQVEKVRKLFRDGNTVFLMGTAMDKLDVPNNMNILREIIVTDTRGPNGETLEMVVIPHEDVVF